MDLGGDKKKKRNLTENLDENSQAFSDADAVQASHRFSKSLDLIPFFIGGYQIGPKILFCSLYLAKEKGTFRSFKSMSILGGSSFSDLLSRIWPLFIEFQGMKQLSCGFFMMEFT